MYLRYFIFILDQAPLPKLWGSCRLSIAFCVFLASVQLAMLRDNLGIALLCMSKPIGNLTCEKNVASVPTPAWVDRKQVRYYIEFFWWGEHLYD